MEIVSWIEHCIDRCRLLTVDFIPFTYLDTSILILSSRSPIRLTQRLGKTFQSYSKGVSCHYIHGNESRRGDL